MKTVGDGRGNYWLEEERSIKCNLLIFPGRNRNMHVNLELLGGAQAIPCSQVSFLPSVSGDLQLRQVHSALQPHFSWRLSGFDWHRVSIFLDGIDLRNPGGFPIGLIPLRAFYDSLIIGRVQATEIPEAETAETPRQEAASQHNQGSSLGAAMIARTDRMDAGQAQAMVLASTAYTEQTDGEGAGTMALASSAVQDLVSDESFRNIGHTDTRTGSHDDPSAMVTAPESADNESESLGESYTPDGCYGV